jgi:excisionase family DNA binding protein
MVALVKVHMEASEVRMFSTGQVAEMLGVSRQWVRQLVSMANINVLRVGAQRERCFTKEQIESMRALVHKDSK